MGVDHHQGGYRSGALFDLSDHVFQHLRVYNKVFDNPMLRDQEFLDVRSRVFYESLAISHSQIHSNSQKFNLPFSKKLDLAGVFLLRSHFRSYLSFGVTFCVFMCCQLPVCSLQPYATTFCRYPGVVGVRL